VRLRHHSGLLAGDHLPGGVQTTAGHSLDCQPIDCIVVCMTTVQGSVPHPLPGPLVDVIAQRFRAMGEPMRIRILDALRDGPLVVGDLAAAVSASQQNVSKHVAVLVQAGLVSREKEGTRVRCAIADPAVFQLCDLVCGGIRRQLAGLDQLLTEGGA
jgi:DNA-binding transcriptional ArsR family regulator